MNRLNMAAQFESIVFQVPVDNGVTMGLSITYLSPQEVSLVVVSPDEYTGGIIGLPHVPYFGMPGIFGYYYAGRLTPKFTEYIREFTREWYAKRQAVTERLAPVQEYLAIGLSMKDAEEWIESETGLRFRYEEFSRIFKEILAHM
jgi:hypothetical protein